MNVYYNEHDKHAAQWLRNLGKAGLIQDGFVDERDIQLVRPADLSGYGQCHFFAGIGGWPYALQLAGWGERRVWTASCPCQPFSQAGRGRGVADERHLWPVLRDLVRDCPPDIQPSTIFGEQVASEAGRLWFTGVRADLEAMGFAVGAADLCAAGVGAPHIRQRLYWVADCNIHGRDDCEKRGGISESEGGSPPSREGARIERKRSRDTALGSGSTAWMAESDGEGRTLRVGLGKYDAETGNSPRRKTVIESRDSGRMVNPQRLGLSGELRGGAGCLPADGRSNERPWDEAQWVGGADGKTRRIKPGIEPLVDGIPFRLDDGSTRKGASRSSLLKGIGNAIVPVLAAEFVKAYMETL